MGPGFEKSYFPSQEEESFFDHGSKAERLAEALGVAVVVAGIPTSLAVASLHPRNKNLFKMGANTELLPLNAGYNIENTNNTYPCIVLIWKSKWISSRIIPHRERQNSNDHLSYRHLDLIWCLCRARKIEILRYFDFDTSVTRLPKNMF